ncbi:hypothetical protein SLS62_002297 [Diatrype stigma]|uniref:Uncharacterized protein n=1 Tax=Diatrype stigma TaxID=117547 RepID=A0AAN9UY30_9PEZI
MSTQAAPRTGTPALLVASLLACALVGGYAAVSSMGRSGFTDAIFTYVVDADPHDKSAGGFPGAPAPLLRRYTGIEAVDYGLAVLVGFFSGLIGGDVAPQYRLFTLWGMTQFGACWTLVALEGLRAGNRGRLVSWTGTAGLLVQTCSWTITVPLWLILHLFTSPVAKLAPSSPSPSALLVDLWDLAVLPLAITLTFITPALPMLLPSHFGAWAHYAATALWQPFPLWHSLAQSGLSRVARFVERTQGSPSRSPADHQAYLAQARSVYGFVTMLSVAAQVTVLQVVLAPPAVRESLARTYPSLRAYAAPDVTFASVFVPRGAPPVVDPAALASGDLAGPAVYFFQYDMYFGCGAMLLWALHLHRNALRGRAATSSANAPLRVAARVAWWFALGGFAGALSTLLWERDVVVVEGEEAEGKKMR